MDNNHIPSRKNFMLRGLGLAAMLVAAAIPFVPKKKKEEKAKKTVKMLTQDGQLVEVDEALLTGQRQKITNAGLKKWVNKPYCETPSNLK